jgi:thymidylate synthase
MTLFEANYIKLVKKIVNEGEDKEGRNGGTRSLFGETIDLGNIFNEFPIIQGRKMHHKGVLGELAAMLNKPKHIDDFTDKGCNYWGKWAKEDGSINVDYGNAWYNFNGFDQIADLKHKLRTSPNDRRMIVSGWNPSNLDKLDLPCCHMVYQFHVSKGNTLNMLWTQRSVDTMIGLPSDAIFAAAWLIILANEVGLKPGNIKMSLGDTHIYHKHLDKVKDYLNQAKSISTYLPRWELLMEKERAMEEFMPNMLALTSYKYRNPISFELIG